MGDVLSLYLPSFPVALVYMLQSTEYQSGPYLKWFWRTQDFKHVANRRSLDTTKAAQLLLVALRTGMLLQIIVAVFIMGLGITQQSLATVGLGLGLYLLYPVLWAHLVVIPLWLGRLLIVQPKEKRLIQSSKQIFKSHKGVKIAVAGSYGKTSMKELLLTILSEGKRVAATPANKNVPSSHAVYAQKLDGDEDVLIIEYGEGKPGDVAQFVQTTHPTIGVITGLAPAHLDHYPSVAAAGEDIMELAHALPAKSVYFNGESPDLQAFKKDSYQVYGTAGLGEWKVSKVSVNFDGTHFTVGKGATKYNLHSGLLGRHHIGPLVAAVVIAHDLGLTKQQIEAGVSKTVAYEHRMQPRPLHDAWVIDDTYNGNIEGVKAGTALLKELPARRKIYVTPGLVDQGSQARPVHKTMGQLIAQAQPDIVVLMHNSVTGWITEGLEQAGYTGTIQVEQQPLKFYTNLDQFLAAGDVIMMQNDWTDNYN